MKKSSLLILSILLGIIFSFSAVNAEDPLNIYFFHLNGCVHCAEEAPYLEELVERYDGKIQLIDFELYDHPENVELLGKFGLSYGFEPSGVPATFIGNKYWIGFDENNKIPFENAIDNALANGAPDPAEIVRGEAVLDPVKILFFHGDGCSHCAQEEPFLEDLTRRYGDRVQIEEHEIWFSEENQTLGEAYAAAYEYDWDGSVPFTLIGNRYWLGFNEDKASEMSAFVSDGLDNGIVDPQDILDGIVTLEGKPVVEPNIITLPLIGEVNLDEQSLTVVTIIIGLVDGVNPCSLWVLTMLLAMIIHTDSRKKTLIIGIVFLTVTAGIYALFIMGVFTVLSYINYIRWIRIAVAAVTLVMGFINLKDYFFFKEGVSLTIDDAKKPGIYKKMRNVLKNSDNFWAMIGATVILAAGVSLVEFSCTAAFPVIWSNILSAHEVSRTTFLLQLLLYMVLYQLDEMVIFIIAVITMKSKRMEEKHGQVLKLFSGVLMVVLSAVMLIRPELMNGLLPTLLVFALALVITVLILLLTAVILPKFGIYIGHRRHDAPVKQTGSDTTENTDN